VETAADEKLAEARQHVRQALKAINEIVVDECSGHDDFTPEFSVKLRDAHLLLIQVRDKLNVSRS
jgi:hypothetical protein